MYDGTGKSFYPRFLAIESGDPDKILEIEQALLKAATRKNSAKYWLINWGSLTTVAWLLGSVSQDPDVVALLVPTSVVTAGFATYFGIASIMLDKVKAKEKKLEAYYELGEAGSVVARQNHFIRLQLNLMPEEVLDLEVSNCPAGNTDATQRARREINGSSSHP